VCVAWLLSLFSFRFNANERHASPSPPPMHVSTSSPSHGSRVDLVLLAHSASVSHGHIAQCSYALCGHVCCCCPALRGCHLPHERCMHDLSRVSTAFPLRRSLVRCVLPPCAATIAHSSLVLPTSVATVALSSAQALRSLFVSLATHTHRGAVLF
jgi:hypothetical protein